MNIAPKKRFYWLEGVTRAEVEKSLDDRRPSPFRRQGPRRLLVAANVVALGLLAVADYLPGIKVSTYLAIAALLAALLLYLRLRGAIRLVADAPDELLDERQITIRNAAHVLAYRFLAIASVVFVGFWLGMEALGLSEAAQGKNPGMNLLVSYTLLLASLPSMVLAWGLPSEPEP